MKRIKKHISSIRKSKDGRTLVANFGYLSLLQIAGYIFPLITIPYLARVIGVDGFGKIAFAAAVLVWFENFADWGFNFTATRDVAQNRKDIEKVSEIFSNVIWAKTLLTFVAFILLSILIWLIPTFRENSIILLVSFLLLPSNILFPQWMFQAFERMRYITILSLLAKLLFTLAVFVFIKEKSDFILQPLFTSLGAMLSGLIAMYFIIGKWGVKLKKPSLKLIFSAIKDSTDVFINNLMPNLFGTFSTILLGFFGGAISNGILDAGKKFQRISKSFLEILSRTFYPFLSRRIDKHDLYVKINSYTALLISIMLFIAAPLIIKLFYTPEFYDGIKVLRIVAFSILFHSWINIYGTNYMILQGYERPLRNITLIWSLIGFAITFPLVYYLDYIGAALTSTITRGLLGGSIMWKAKRIKREKTHINN